MGKRRRIATMAKKKLAVDNIKNPPELVCDNLQVLNTQLLDEAADLRKQVKALKATTLSLEYDLARSQSLLSNTHRSEVKRLREADMGKAEVEEERGRLMAKIGCLEEEIEEVAVEKKEMGERVVKLSDEKARLGGKVERIVGELDLYEGVTKKGDDEEAHKRNFWALFSSASIIVATSVAYLVRWR